MRPNCASERAKGKKKRERESERREGEREGGRSVSAIGNEFQHPTHTSVEQLVI